MGRIYADDRGVWEEEDRWSAYALGTEWDAIVAVAACRDKGISRRSETTVEILLSLPGDDDMTLSSDQPGFAEVIEAVGRQLPGMPAEWLARIDRLRPQDGMVTVWSRPEDEVAPPSGYPRLRADERGIWRENRPGRRFLVEWAKIDEVAGQRGGSPADAVVYTGLELELAHQGPFPVGLNAAWPGFAEVAEAMIDRLPGMPAGWLDQIAQMPPLTDAPPDTARIAGVRVWRRRREELSAGYPRLYADDEGVWRERKPGRRGGVAWGEISGVSCVFREGMGGETLVSVALEVGSDSFSVGREAGEPLLPELVAAMTARLGMPEGWYDRAKLMKPTRAPLLAWRRPDPGFRLRADDRGVWEGEKLLAEWDVVLGVLARKRHEQGRPDGAIWIDLNVANAPRESLHDSRQGFREVVEAIGDRLPGMPGGWFADVERLQPGNEVTVWRRACPDGIPRLYADDEGVWREDTPGQRFGVEWYEIDRVLGSKKEGAPGHVVIDLEWEGVNHLFLESDMAGFGEAVEAIATRLPHMPAAWLEKIERLRPGYALWRRDWIIANERLGPDGMLVTTWRRIES